MPNIDLVCSDCKNSFYFSERDQEFYKAQNFQPPRRCFACRKARKAKKESGAPADAVNVKRDDDAYDIWNR